MSMKEYDALIIKGQWLRKIFAEKRSKGLGDPWQQDREAGQNPTN